MLIKRKVQQEEAQVQQLHQHGAGLRSARAQLTGHISTPHLAAACTAQLTGGGPAQPGSSRQHANVKVAGVTHAQYPVIATVK